MWHRNNMGLKILTMKKLKNYSTSVVLSVQSNVTILATYYCFSTYVEMKDNPSHQGDFILTLNLEYYWNLAKTYLALGMLLK